METGHKSFKEFQEWHKKEGTERRVSGGDKRKRRNRELEESDEALKSKAEKSGISLGILKQVYNRGMAAYKTGHRPGTTAQQWALARVNSFITKGKGTWGGADKDLAAKARGGAKKEQAPCWDGYKQVGMKKKGDKMVPDCVPESFSGAEKQPFKSKAGAGEFASKELEKKYRKGTPGQPKKKIEDVTVNETTKYKLKLSKSQKANKAFGDNYQLYHKTFSGAMQHSYQVAKKRGYKVSADSIDTQVAMGPRKPSNGKTNSYHLDLDGERNKKLRVQVYNTGSSYELNMYIESAELNESISRKDFDKLKKGDKIEINYGSTMAGSKTREFSVVGRSRSAKYDVDKIRLQPTDKTGGMKFFLYSRSGGDATLALGDMGASIKSYRLLEEVELEEQSMTDNDWVVVGKGRKPVRFLKNPKNNKAPRNWQKSSDEQEVIRVSKAKQMGIIKKESVELNESKYKYDGKVAKISKKEFAKVHKDYKNTTKGKERMMILDPKTGSSISVPVQFEEVELDEKLKVGDKVKFKKGIDPKTARSYGDAIRKSGKVVKDYGDGDVKVNFGGNNDKSVDAKLLVKEEVELDENLKKAEKLMGPSKNKQQGIEFIMKGMKVSREKATKMADEILRRAMKASSSNRAMREEELEEAQLRTRSAHRDELKRREKISKGLKKTSQKTTYKSVRGRLVSDELEEKKYSPSDEKDIQKTISIMKKYPANKKKSDKELRDGAIEYLFHNRSMKRKRVETTEGFSAAQLVKLKKAYSTVSTVDPTSPTYKKLTKLIKSQDKDALTQIAKAKVKFVSQIAATELRRAHNIKLKASEFMEEIEMNESEFKTVRGKDGKKYDVKISMDGKKFKFRVTDKTGNVGAFKVISLGQAAKLFENLEEIVDITEESGIELARKIVDRKQHMKGIDLTTAGLILQVYDKVNDKNKAKMDKMSAKQLASVVYKLLSKEEVQEDHDMYGYKLFEEELDEAHCSSKRMKKEGITDEDVAQFIGAASAAKKAGKKNFSFGGKTYPVTISGDTAKKVLEDSLKEEMDPTEHVEKNKETGMYCVYDANGKKVKEFEDKKEADDYATKNHEKLMAVKESKYTDIEELIESSDKKDAAEMSKLVKELQPKISKSELKKEVEAMAMEKYKNKTRAKKIASFA